MTKKPSIAVQRAIQPPRPMRYDELLETLGTKDRQTFERQVAACETAAGPGLGERWKRLACLLMALAPFPPRFDGIHTIQFFIPDGKYRKQVFAMHALDDGAMAVCTPDVLKKALSSGILEKAKSTETGNVVYPIRNSTETLSILCKDGSESNPESYYKAMTGWNRKAICIILSPRTTQVQMDAVAVLCTMAAREWSSAAE